MPGLSDEEKTKYTVLFQKVVYESEESDGALSIDDFNKLLVMCGHRLNRGELALVFCDTDLDGDWKITLEEFLDFISKVAPSGSPQSVAAAIRRKFDEQDLNKDGFISLEELRIVLSQVNVNLSEEWLDMFMKQWDLDKDGKINFEEFVNMYVKSELADSDDDDEDGGDKFADDYRDMIISADGIKRICHEKSLVEEGMVKVEDLKNVLSSVKMKLTDEQLAECLNLVDPLESGSANLEQFVSAYENKIETILAEEEESRVAALLVAGQVTEQEDAEEGEYGGPTEEEQNGDFAEVAVEIPLETKDQEERQTQRYEEPEETDRAPVEVREDNEKPRKISIEREINIGKMSAVFEGKKETPSRHNRSHDDGAKNECKDVGVRALIAKFGNKSK